MQLKEKTERKDSDAGTFWLICKIFKSSFLKKKAPQDDCFCSRKKYFTNKIVKSLLKKEYKIGNY